MADTTDGKKSDAGPYCSEFDDITVFKQAEEDLRTSRQWLALHVEQTPLAVIEWDKDFRVREWNPAAEGIFGHTREEAMGRHAMFIVAEATRTQVDKVLSALIAQKGGQRSTNENLTRDGRRIICEWYNTSLVDADGNTIGVASLVMDITERKLLEAQLQQARKMESVGTLAGGIAHNFNNILMGIQGRISLMLAEKGAYHPDVEHLKGIEEYVGNATGLTKALLGFARGGKYEVIPTDLNALIEKENLMFGKTRKEIEINGTYERDPWPVDIDQGQIKQVLMNLYVNAWQAMPGGGPIHVQTENIRIDPDDISMADAKPGRYVKIAVTDTGVGMDPVTKDRIFDPFFTTRDDARGTGLGLASVYGIVKNHGGFVRVYSELGKGTAFNIYLPASTSEVRGKKPAIDERYVVDYGHGTVLLVDDEEMIIDVGQQLLTKLGYSVLTAHNGKQAQEVFSKNKDKIALVILDMIMPGMNGGEVYDRLKQMDPTVKVLLSSGYSLTGQAKEILDRGCNEFIQKPFRLLGLSQKIKKILG